MKRHTGWEVGELWVAEHYWPTGEPADSQRALMICRMIEAGHGNDRAALAAQRIWQKLAGIADPGKVNQRGLSPKQIKTAMSGFQ